MSHNNQMAVIGLGYVGLPVAVAFAAQFPVIGFDIDPMRVQDLKKGIDHTNAFSAEQLKQPNLIFTSQKEALREAQFFIITVPTPIDAFNKPDLTALHQACELLGPQLKEGDVVVIESTVYPGATQAICLPLLEHYSRLKAGHDFFMGYSPERINTADPQHGFTQTVKVVSALDPETLELIADRYSAVIPVGVHRVESIVVAEASKLVENIQRDVNIALMNELAQLFSVLNIDTTDVLAAAQTKWNFMPFKPGLVGGHCIGAAPYHLKYQAALKGYTPELMTKARQINEKMDMFIAQEIVKTLIQHGVNVRGALVTLLGFTYKENCSDIRHSRISDLKGALESYGIEIQVHDPLADPHETYKEYDFELIGWEELCPSDAMVLCVPHDYYETLSAQAYFDKLHRDRLLFDLKGKLDKQALNALGISVWRL